MLWNQRLCGYYYNAIIKVTVGRWYELKGSVGITITAIIKVNVGRWYDICEYYIRDTLVCCF